MDHLVEALPGALQPGPVVVVKGFRPITGAERAFAADQVSLGAAGVKLHRLLRQPGGFFQLFRLSQPIRFYDIDPFVPGGYLQRSMEDTLPQVPGSAYYPEKVSRPEKVFVFFLRSQFDPPAAILFGLFPLMAQERKNIPYTFDVTDCEIRRISLLR
jgi:hypothetical protein